jgi:hypothetical protein
MLKELVKEMEIVDGIRHMPSVHPSTPQKSFLYMENGKSPELTARLMTSHRLRWFT